MERSEIFLQKVDPVFLHRSRLNMYGGTTNHFGFWARPLDPIDFLPRPGFRHVAWPFTADELKPYYVDAPPIRAVRSAKL